MNQPYLSLAYRKRNDDYQVFLRRDSRMWESGKTLEEAVGKWIVTRGKDFGITVGDSSLVSDDTMVIPLPNQPQPRTPQERIEAVGQ